MYGLCARKPYGILVQNNPFPSRYRDGHLHLGTNHPFIASPPSAHPLEYSTGSGTYTHTKWISSVTNEDNSFISQMDRDRLSFRQPLWHLSAPPRCPFVSMVYWLPASELHWHVDAYRCQGRPWISIVSSRHPHFQSLLLLFGQSLSQQ